MVAESSKKDMLNFFSAICLIPVIILCMRPANERQRYAVTLSLMIPVILAKLGARTMTGSYNQVFLNAGAKLVFTVVIH